MPSMLGFTFGFGAQDRGLKSSFGSVKDSLADVAGQVSKLGGIAKNVNLGAMFAGFGMAGLSRISGQLDKIVGGNVNLVNGLESTMIASKKAARVIGAQAGLMGGDLAKFTATTSSLAYGMNLGIDQVANAQKQYGRLSGDFRKGLNKSGVDLKDFLRAEEATGVTSEDLMKNLSGLAGSFGFTGEQAGSFLDKFTAASLAGGLGKVAFGTMKTTLDDLKTSLQQNSKFLALDAEQKRKYVEDQIIGTQRLAGTIYKTFGGDEGEAQSAATAFAKKLNEEQVAISGMLAGLGKDYGELFTSVGKEAGIGVAEAFVGKTPDEAMKVLLLLRSRFMAMGKDGEGALQRLNTQFAEIAPQMQVGLLTKEKAAEFSANMGSIEAATDKAKGAFDKFGKAAYTSGLSASDSVSRAKDAFESAMLKIGGGSQGYANEQVKAYKNVTKGVQELSSDKNWGPLMKRFALATRLGMSAFFLPMKQEGDSLKNQYASISESMGQGGLQGRFEAIRQLGVAGLFLDMGKASVDMGGAIGDAQDKAQGLYEKFLQAKLAFDNFLPVLIAVAGALGALFGVLKLGNAALSVFTTTFGMLGSTLSAIVGIGGSVVSAITSVGGAVVGLGKNVGDFLFKAGEGESSVAAKLYDKLATPFRKTAENLGKAGPKITSSFGNVFGEIGEKIGSKLSPANNAIIGRVSTFFTNLGPKLLTAVTAAGAWFGSTAVGAWFASVGATIASAAASVSAFFAPVVAAFTSVVSMLMPILGALFSGPVGWAVLAGLIIAGLIAMIGSMSDKIKASILGFFDKIPDFAVMLKNWAANLGATIRDFVVGLPAMLLSLVAKFGSLVESGGQFLMALADKIQFAIMNFDFAGIIMSFFDNLFAPSNVEGGFDWGALLSSILGLLFNVGKAYVYVLQFTASILTTIGGSLLEGFMKLGPWLLQKLIDGLAWMLKKQIDFLLLPINGALELLGKEPIDPFGNYISPNIPKIRRDSKDVAAAVKDGAKDIANAAAEGAKEASLSAFDKAKGGVVNLFEKMADKMKPEAIPNLGNLVGAMGVDLDLGDEDLAERLNQYNDSLSSVVMEQLQTSGVELEKMTKAQQDFVQEAFTNTAIAMAKSGKDFSDENQKTLAAAIVDSFKTQAAIDRLKEEKGSLWAAMHGGGDGTQSFTPEEQARRDQNLLAAAQAEADYGISGAFTDEQGNFVGPDTGFTADNKIGAAPTGMFEGLDLSGLAGGALEAGKGVLSATADGLKAGAPVVTDALGEAMHALANKLPKKGQPMPVESPLVNVKDSGVQIMAEIARGMIDGTTLMVGAMKDAMTAVRDELVRGMNDVYSTMYGGFELAGQAASNAFTRGVFLEQDLQLGVLKDKLFNLFAGEFVDSIKVVDVQGEAGSATVSVDSAATIVKELVTLREQTITQLKSIVLNTQNTADNTASLRGKVGNFTLVAQGK